MTRTPLTPLVAVRNGGVVLGAGVTPPVYTTGMIVNGPVGPYKLEVLVYNNNGSTAMNVIFRASGYQGTPGQAANSGYLTGQYQPFADASAGDLSVSVAAPSYVLFTDLETDRFTQADGSLWIDVSLETTVKIWAIQKPYMP